MKDNPQKPYTDRAERQFESRGFKEGREHVVNKVKNSAAVLFDAIDNIPVEPGNSEAGRLVSLAKTELEATVMWAVKAVSRS